MTTQNNSQPSAWQRVNSLWHRTDRARALAQIPLVLAPPVAGTIADQVRLAPPTDPPAIHQNAEAELQKQWAEHEIHRLENGAAYIVRDEATRERPDHEHGR